MKFSFGKTAIHRMMGNIVVVIVGISFYFALINLKTISDGFSMVMDILKPFVYGFVIAFLLNNPVKYFDNLLARLIRADGLRRGLSVGLALVIFTQLIGLLIAVLVPQLIDSAVTLVSNIQDFLLHLDQNMDRWFYILTQEYQIDPGIHQKITNMWDSLLTKGSALLIAALQQLLGLTGQVTSGIINLFVAVIISVYLLMSKEVLFAQLRKVLYALLQEKTVEKLLYVGNLTNRTFNGFINGKLIDSLIIGILAFICLSVMKMPYVLLISVIIGVTNIIPFFGPFIGAIPSAFIIFIVDPVQALWFLLFILVLQQVDGNIIGPRILGGSTGLPTIWVVFAILTGGGLAGFAGMIVGVPITAVCYTLFKSYIRQRLEQKQLPADTEAYRTAWTGTQEKGEASHESESTQSDS